MSDDLKDFLDEQLSKDRPEPEKPKPKPTSLDTWGPRLIGAALAAIAIGALVPQVQQIAIAVVLIITAIGLLVLLNHIMSKK